MDILSKERAGNRTTGYQMIHSISISNFRCYRSQTVDCKRINVLVGDNGSGKTSLLEAIFLTLSGNLEVSVRLRGQRGLSGMFNGAPRAIEEAIWRDYFHNLDWTKPVNIKLSGHGTEARALEISRVPSQVTIALEKGGDLSSATTTGPLVFMWTDAYGQEHSASPKFTNAGIQLPSSEEDLPDFFYFGAGQQADSVEVAAKFSEARKHGRDRQFMEAFMQEYTWIDELSIEVSGGAPHLFARLKESGIRLPLANISGGINRYIAMLLSIAARPASVLLVDEIESGQYHSHLRSLWGTMCRFARTFDSQLFLVTHSEEWLTALVDGTDGNLDDVCLFRTDYDGKTATLKQFSGKTLRAGIEYGTEIR